MSQQLRAKGVVEETVIPESHLSTSTRDRTTPVVVRMVALVAAMALQACAQTTESGSAAVANSPAAAKRVVIDKTTQQLTGFEGDKVVFRSRVSTGRAGRRTPSGRYKAGVKLRMHYSRLYNNAPMPWSVQVSGNYFIHGFSSVPNRPASHGCIRLPLDGDNPAKQFFEWVEPGTPIEVTGEWVAPPPSRQPIKAAN